MPRNYAQIDSEVDQAFDFFVAHPSGVTLTRLASHLRLSPDQARRRIHMVRKVFANDPGVGLVCDPQGQGEQWLYRLVDNRQDAAKWNAGRARYSGTMLETWRNVNNSILLAHDARTAEGRLARFVVKQIERVLEDIAELSEV